MGSQVMMEPWWYVYGSEAVVDGRQPRPGELDWRATHVGRLGSGASSPTSPSYTLPSISLTMSADSAPTPSPASANPLVFFDISIGGKPAGKIVFELYADVVPKTVSSSVQSVYAICLD